MRVQVNADGLPQDVTGALEDAIAALVAAQGLDTNVTVTIA